uniref:Si:dkeyp-106c3.3 n=1 Tax=Latimeria chalumnae TaxID=7897 RepID=H2ZS43_LATCH
VGSFVWSHLSQLLETDDPVKQQVRDLLPDDIIEKDYDLETWKYSSYSDATFHLESGNVNLEAATVFSSKSFVPRSATANLTLHMMGQAVNLLELGLRLENADHIVKKLFQPSETSKNSVNLTEDSLSYVLARQDNPFTVVCLFFFFSVTSLSFINWMGKNKDLKCGLSVKIFGNELSFLDCDDIRNEMKQYSLSLAEVAVKLLKGQEIQYNKKLSLVTEELTFPTISGLPVRLALNVSAATNIRVKGNLEFKQWSNFFITGYIKPSALIHLSAQMGIVGIFGEAGLNWVTGMRTSTSLDGGVQVKKGQDLKVFLNTPEQSMEIID